MLYPKDIGKFDGSFALSKGDRTRWTQQNSKSARHMQYGTIQIEGFGEAGEQSLVEK